MSIAAVLPVGVQSLMAMPKQTTASDLYALSQGTSNIGPEECHWCASNCKRIWFHDDAPPVPFIRSKSMAMRTNNPYICTGCWLFRRKRITVTELGGKWKDGQQPICHSWWITDKGAWVVNPKDPESIYPLLLKPPNRFVLAILDGVAANHLQLMQVNDIAEIRAETPLRFTVNNIPHTYTVYELQEALEGAGEGKQIGDGGKQPGVGALIRLLGKRKSLVSELMPTENRGRGRPAVRQNTPKRTVTLSGAMA